MIASEGSDLKACSGEGDKRDKIEALEPFRRCLVVGADTCRKESSADERFVGESPGTMVTFFVLTGLKMAPDLANTERNEAPEATRLGTDGDIGGIEPFDRFDRCVAWPLLRRLFAPERAGGLSIVI